MSNVYTYVENIDDFDDDDKYNEERENNNVNVVDKYDYDSQEHHDID